MVGNLKKKVQDKSAKALEALKKRTETLGLELIVRSHMITFVDPFNTNEWMMSATLQSVWGIHDANIFLDGVSLARRIDIRERYIDNTDDDDVWDIPEVDEPVITPDPVRDEDNDDWLFED